MNLLRLFTLAGLMLATVLTVAHAESAEPLRVVAYNIKHGQGMDDKVDLERIAKVIAAQDPDIVALQEVDKHCKRSGNQDIAKVLGELLGMEHRFAKTINFQNGEYGNAVLSRLPILKTQTHPLPKGAENRVALEVVVKYNDKPFSFVSLHLDNLSDEIRVQQVQSLVDSFAASEHPVMLAGDFNAARFMPPMQALLESGWNVLEKNDGNGTRTMQGEKHRKDSDTAERYEIDFLALKGFSAFTVTHGVVPEFIASDHRPIYAVFDFAAVQVEK